MFRFREIKAKTAYQIYALSWSHELPAAEVSEWSSNLAVRWPALQWEPGTLQQAADASSWSSWTFLHAERFEQVHRRFVGTLCVTSGGRHLAMRTTLQRRSVCQRVAHQRCLVVDGSAAFWQCRASSKEEAKATNVPDSWQMLWYGMEPDASCDWTGDSMLLWRKAERVGTPLPERTFGLCFVSHRYSRNGLYPVDWRKVAQRDCMKSLRACEKKQFFSYESVGPRSAGRCAARPRCPGSKRRVLKTEVIQPHLLRCLVDNPLQSVRSLRVTTTGESTE